MSAEPGSRHRGPHQLPPGRHGLSRRDVALNQRERLLEAVADVVSLTGYQAMSVEDVIGAAGVSRRTFYDTFAGKEAAFLAALEAIGGQLLDGVNASARAHPEFAACVVASLDSVLRFVAAEPRYAELCIVEVLAAGPAAIERRNAVITGLAGLLHDGARTVARGSHPPRLTAEAIIGGIYEVIYARVLQGRAAELPALLSELAYSTMLPYLGHSAADRAVAERVARPPS